MQLPRYVMEDVHAMDHVHAGGPVNAMDHVHAMDPVDAVQLLVGATCDAQMMQMLLDQTALSAGAGTAGGDGAAHEALQQFRTQHMLDAVVSFTPMSIRVWASTVKNVIRSCCSCTQPLQQLPFNFSTAGETKLCYQ